MDKTAYVEIIMQRMTMLSVSSKEGFYLYTIQNLRYVYGSKTVLSNLSFTLPIGKIIALAGENGSGKSTLLRLLAGTMQPTTGSILYNQQKVDNTISKYVSYMPDTNNYFLKRTGDQIFEFYDTVFDDFCLNKAYNIAEFLKVDGSKLVKDLSKGQRGRLKMAVVLARNTTYYLLDEPFSGLDPIVRDQLIDGLIEFTDRTQQTIVLSTHELSEVERIIDGLLLLYNGQLLSYEAIDAIRKEWQQDAVSWMKSQYERVD